ncbi:uncharacterized protein [Physcomitrium patens]|uniref:Uncharacterized protein n=1 Tax=Physcomitrium patens TaxID=3218 RepID=A9SG47_PHYPA|nr:uncharacterized protein LOC112284315 [Physcomitrium patens]PNR51168.1 hypothetical protein PHYPA_010354 [Physcomitrium patens]|eukprot:XP_024379785.1 uncharacterized protein LOC112284315 [Physcomitrella patens]
MGGAPHDAHYPGYPTQVWSPTGGWWCHPKLWRRNTVIAFAGIFAVCIPIAMKSAQLEQRPLMPVRPVPSQMWCKNFGDKEAATD